MSRLNNFFKFSFRFPLVYQCMITLIPYYNQLRDTNSAIYDHLSAMLYADNIAER